MLYHLNINLITHFLILENNLSADMHYKMGKYQLLHLFNYSSEM